jgi:hypothetical protein
MKATARPPSRSKGPVPGFALCNPVQSEASTTYMREHGAKIAELFGREESEKRPTWQTEVLEQLIGENQSGFFVTDLQELQELATNLLRAVRSDGSAIFTPYFKQIISLSMVPFRKISNGDDRRCFHHIGGFFGALCPILTLELPELQMEAASALSWFSKNCGPLNISEDSTFNKFFPRSDTTALYSFIPTALRTEEVVKLFVETFSELLDNLATKPCNSDILALCFGSLFEFVKRGCSSAIPPTFINNVLAFIVNHSEIKITVSAPAGSVPPLCSTRVLAATLLFFDSFVQESQQAMTICTSQVFVSTMWNLFVSALFSSFKNVQKRIRNEILGLIMLIMRNADASLLEKNSMNKMFDLCQSIALLVPDQAVSVTYSNKTRNLRLTHEPVDIEIIILAQDLALILHQITPLLPPRNEYIEHQIAILKGNMNKYLVESASTLAIQGLQLLHAFVSDVEHFIKNQGITVLAQMIKDSLEDEPLFYALLLVLKQFQIFKNKPFVETLMRLRSDNDKILTLTLSVLAVLMQSDQPMVECFMELGGLDLLKACFVSKSAEVVLSAIDCARSIAPFVFVKIDQRLVFMLLDCADNSPTLLRYGFVGLFLDLIPFKAFIEASLLWKSLRTNSNIQRTIAKWWRAEEERLDIKYDKCIIIDIDKPLNGHPLASRTLRKVVVEKDWLLDKNNLAPPTSAYKLDFRARLFLFLEPFPRLAEDQSKPTDRIKELMIRAYKELKRGGVWMELRDQLSAEHTKPLHDDKLRISHKLEKMRELSLSIQEEQCNIWQKCESDMSAREQRIYIQLNEGMKTAQYVAENYKAIITSQPIAFLRPYQGRTVKGEDVLVRAGNLRTQQKTEILTTSGEQPDDTVRRDRERHTYINDCLQDESISYLVRLMKNAADPNRETE